MTFLIGLFARWGLPESVRRPLAMVTTIIAVAGLCGLLWTCWLRSHDKARDDVVTVETVKTDAKAKEKAAEERGSDAAKIDQAEKDRADAIHKATDSQPSDASRRLNCERLRRAGKDTSRIAACAGLGR